MSLVLISSGMIHGFSGIKFVFQVWEILYSPQVACESFLLPPPSLLPLSLDEVLPQIWVIDPHFFFLFFSRLFMSPWMLSHRLSSLIFLP